MRVIGEMLEWLKRHAWKACSLLKGLASSNLALSANNQRLCRHAAEPFSLSGIHTRVSKKPPIEANKAPPIGAVADKSLSVNVLNRLPPTHFR